MTDLNSLLYFFTIAALPILLAITLHEAAHGWVAQRLGDPTAKSMGRLSMNPLHHIDPVGTVLVPVAMLVMSGFLFGWAKPVPVDPRNFKRPLQHMGWVALAGPMANFIMALFWTLFLALASHVLKATWIGQPLYLMAEAGIKINVILMVLNLLPLPPLDGGRILTGMLKPRAAYTFSKIEPYGIWILLILLLTGILGKVLWPVVQWFEGLFFLIAGV